MFKESKESESHERLRSLQFIDEASQSNVPDIKHLEENQNLPSYMNVDNNIPIKPTHSIGVLETHANVVDDIPMDPVDKDVATGYMHAALRDKRTQQRRNKRSRVDYDEEDDTNSLSSSHSSISNISEFEFLNVSFYFLHYAGVRG